MLEQFAASEDKDLVEAEKIDQALSSLLDREMFKRSGKKPQPAVLVQGRQAQARLWEFAKWQAGRRQDGWKITEAELSFKESDNVCVELGGGKTLVLTGTIDRVEFNERSGKTAVLDYKTFSKAKSPQQVHLDYEGNWVNLQLPLYVELMKSRGVEWPDELGFVCLSAASLPTDKVLSLADWTEEDIDSARMMASEIAQEILSGEIPDPVLLASRFDDFAAICGEGMLHDLSLQLEDSE